MSKWMPPQRVQRMVQYSHPPRPTRPGMMRITTRPALHSGQCDMTPPDDGMVSVSIRMRHRLGLEPKAVDMALGIRDRLIGIAPGEADIECGERDAVDHHRVLIGTADSRVPQAFTRFEGFNVKAVVEAGHLALRVLF